MVLMPTHPSNEKSNYHSIRFLTKHSFLKFVHNLDKYFLRIRELFVEVIFTHFIMLLGKLCVLIIQMNIKNKTPQT